MESAPLVNRVANSGLITIDLEKYYPIDPVHIFDLKDYLFKGLILREKEFRSALKEIKWEEYRDGILIITCTTDAIIPLWAYMLISSHAESFAKEIFVGTEAEYMTLHYSRVIANIDISDYEDGRIVIKGCGDKTVPASAYAQLTSKLQPHVKKIMFGEPCSTVPVFRRK